MFHSYSFNVIVEIIVSRDWIITMSVSSRRNWEGVGGWFISSLVSAAKIFFYIVYLFGCILFADVYANGLFGSTLSVFGKGSYTSRMGNPECEPLMEQAASHIKSA